LEQVVQQVLAADQEDQLVQILFFQQSLRLAVVGVEDRSQAQISQREAMAELVAGREHKIQVRLQVVLVLLIKATMLRVIQLQALHITEQVEVLVLEARMAQVLQLRAAMAVTV
jgi:hypothetical protein